MTNTQKLEINSRELLNLYLQKDYNLLSENLIGILEHFENITYFELGADAQYFINVFVKNFLYLFTQPDYFLNEKHAARFIRLNTTIANLVAMSSFQTTDASLEVLKSQPHNFAKILALYSARNTVRIEPQILFQAYPSFACLWYSHFCELYRSALVNKKAYQNLREHLTFIDEKLTDFHNIADVYYGATFIGASRDRQLKQQLNSSIRKSPFARNVTIANNPNAKKIAIITAKWFPENPVYQVLSLFVESLAADYELTLIHLGTPRENLATAVFKEVKYVDFKDGSLNLEQIRENDFMAVFYPDMGLSAESILLSNLRLAPIQICGHGFPVSTYGSQVDYFISGADVEISEGAEENYSERLVLLPGLGIINQPPNYEPKNPAKKNKEFIINCSWSSEKVNYPMLSLLSEIIRQSKRKIFFRFFTSGVDTLARKNGFIPFKQDLESLLGKDRFEIIPAKPYEEYMELMELGDISLDSYHFGGYNTVKESLYLRQPIVTFEGNKWYNRIGSQMLRAIGLEELIATSAREYMRLTLRLIHEDPYRTIIQQKLHQVNLDETIFSSESKIYLKKAIDLLIEKHSQLQAENSQKPIKIG
ncbi:O-linked N-acetylglucosamine transferase family protein [Oscillatoria salina]|uniref:O-linked N-acetylglucosamine transferase family protein n=1 Tax=Oscillatoria salina TaxID=331517 RepID=UPI0013BCB965|nr:hypothetical protein [Oscillatoria salina]MBZ8180260.1 hypothetical protein [Oscillatoria salina IIICB1]NET89594.1 hypothetical protein [Kamptonema sp. SIO1D9]